MQIDGVIVDDYCFPRSSRSGNIWNRGKGGVGIVANASASSPSPLLSRRIVLAPRRPSILTCRLFSNHVPPSLLSAIPVRYFHPSSSVVVPAVVAAVVVGRSSNAPEKKETAEARKYRVFLKPFALDMYTYHHYHLEQRPALSCCACFSFLPLFFFLFSSCVLLLLNLVIAARCRS